MNRRLLRSALAAAMPPAAMLLLILAVLGRSSTYAAILPGTRLLPDLVVAADAVLLVLWQPSTMVVIGLLVPLLPVTTGSSLPVYGGIVLLLAATARKWPDADRRSRRTALLIWGILLTVVFLNELIATTSPSSSGERLSIVYAGVLGTATAIIRPSRSVIVYSTTTLGCIAALAALTTANLLQARTTVVLGTNANGVGFLAAVGAIAALTLLQQNSTGSRVVGVFAFGLCSAGLFQSGSRGALVAGLAGAVVLVLHRAIASTTVRAAFAASAGAGAVVTVAGPAMSELLKATGRLQSSAATSLDQRQAAFSQALRQGLAHPLTGIGIGNTAGASQRDPNAPLGLSAHNVFAGVFAESGVIPIVGLALLAVLALLRSREFAAAWALPLVITVLVGGGSLEWWGEGQTGPVSMLLLAAGSGLGRSRSRSTDIEDAVPSQFGNGRIAGVFSRRLERSG